MLWDLFCRVVDNHGDLGVAWRLSADLAARGHRVRLWVDDASALAWMAPRGAAGVSVHPWPAEGAFVPPGEVVIELFGCELPVAVVDALAAREPPPVWINLEYLSAEPYVERCHGLRSPQSTGPAAGLNKWFFYPGFTPATGGLLRETTLTEEQAAFDGPAWLAARGWAAQPGEQVVVLFCYDASALPRLVQAWAGQPTLLLACPGAAQRTLDTLPDTPGLRRIALPWLAQPDFDRLLWSADLNLVRGEDSFVRAMWAGRPFVWQIYPQDDGAHAAKLQAFGSLFERTVAAPGAAERLALSLAWNGLAPWPDGLPDPDDWRQAALRWRKALQAQSDLCTQLCGWVAERR
ncbi:elongation factor P maturation arginine rhamnosyltransferase EarP [Ideonella sp. A 288]|uniref:elongation factor P maturation arginine rhamnosyltransferase EarP n=1 Tax=Ideonella sp. A 288 TaxID=1962181 RepID=UPI000B4B3686|nr:elongation factor P maturation arginine rhamnosyltransferase EarP [Ideonella sp. A 288]